MYHAGLLIGREGKFAINKCSKHELQKLANSTHIFTEYSNCINTAEVEALKYDWIDYVNSFSDISLSYIEDNSSFTELSDTSVQATENSISTKTIGDIGEDLILVHEITRLKSAGKPKLAKIVNKIPTHLAVGYDIKSHNAFTGSPCILKLRQLEPKAFRPFKISLNY